jgi:hypothetical protein
MPIEMKAGLSLDKKEATLEVASMPEALKLTASLANWMRLSGILPGSGPRCSLPIRR